MAKARQTTEPPAEPVVDETALAPRGMGFGGLGDFTEESLHKAVQETGADEKGSATAEDVRDAMGNRVPQLEQVKVKHGGACVFQFPDDTKLDEFLGVIVAFTFHNSNFGKSFDEHEAGDRPICYSHDGVNVAQNSESPQGKSCPSCPRNRDAREKEARSAAFDADRKEVCNNYLSLAVALPGREVPIQLRLSNQSFAGWAEYIQRIGTSGRFQHHEVATRFRLVNKRGGGGAEFSVCTFSSEGALPKPLREAMAAQRANYRALLQRSADTAEPSEDGADAIRKAQSDAKKAAEDCAGDDSGL